MLAPAGWGVNRWTAGKLPRKPCDEFFMVFLLFYGERETGVKVRSFEDWGNPQMFSDTTHLARYGGDVPYTSMLVETYAPMLAR